jgi:hypothetical protein
MLLAALSSLTVPVLLTGVIASLVVIAIGLLVRVIRMIRVHFALVEARSRVEGEKNEKWVDEQREEQ